MESIVEAALENAAAESTDADPDELGEFGPPRAAVVGCGGAGARRVAAATTDYRAANDSRETLVRSIAVGEADATRLEELDERCAWEEAGVAGPAGDTARTAPSPREQFESLLDGTDLQVLTGDLGSPAACRHLSRACTVAGGQRGPTVVVPTLPAGPLEESHRATLADLRADAGCLLPVDPGRLPTDGQQRVATSTSDDIAVDLLSTVLGLTSGSMAFPVDIVTVRELFATGGVAIPFVGTVDYTEDDGPGVAAPAVRRSLHPCYDGAGVALDGQPVGWLSYLVGGRDLTLRQAHRLESVLPEVLVDDADVPSACSGHVDEAVTSEGRLIAFVFTE